MTSGQGNEHGGAPENHGGTPQQQPGWGQPPSPPPYGPPPGQGYTPAPPPPPPMYGYGSAPSAPPGWGPSAPTPVERPVTVRAGLGAFIAEIVLGLVGSVYSLSHFDELVNRALARAQAQSGRAVPVTAADLHGLLIVGVVIGLIVIAAEVLFIWFAWQGRNWARIVLWVVGGLGIVSGLIGLSTNSQYGGFYATLSIFQWVLTITGVVLLALKPSNEWYRYRKWRRMTGQG